MFISVDSKGDRGVFHAGPKYEIGFPRNLRGAEEVLRPPGRT